MESPTRFLRTYKARSEGIGGKVDKPISALRDTIEIFDSRTPTHHSPLTAHHSPHHPSRHRIITASTPWMTAGNSFYCKPEALEDTMLF